MFMYSWDTLWIAHRAIAIGSVFKLCFDISIFSFKSVLSIAICKKYVNAIMAQPFGGLSSETTVQWSTIWLI